MQTKIRKSDAHGHRAKVEINKTQIQKNHKSQAQMFNMLLQMNFNNFAKY